MIGCVFSILRFITCVFMNPSKAWNIAYEVDVMSNVGANGERNTTISARAARARDAGRKWGCVLCKILNRFQKNHCDIALKA